MRSSMHNVIVIGSNRLVSRNKFACR